MVTETDEIAEALADAATRRPGESPSRLSARLIAEGHAALRAGAEARRVAVVETSGALIGLHGPGYPDELREDWLA